MSKPVETFCLLFPLVLLLVCFFYIPIFGLLKTSYTNPKLSNNFHKMQANWQQSDQGIPNTQTMCAFVESLMMVKQQGNIGQLARLLSRRDTRLRSLMFATARQFNGPVDCAAQASHIKKQLAAISDVWTEPSVWQSIKLMTQSYTWLHLLNAFDMTIDDQNQWVLQPVNQRIYLQTLKRTLVLSALITVICLILSYPLAFFLAQSPKKNRHWWLIVILLPLWTPVLVRIVCAIVMLSRYGIINQLLWWIGLIDDSNRLSLIYNATGTVITMVFIQMPYMILALYASMFRLPMNLISASQSLGATGFRTFLWVVGPLTMPGVIAGCTLVFIISTGYYITPAIVGGSQGTFVSNLIDFHMGTTLNWGLASALSVILLVTILSVYSICTRLLGKEIGQ